MTASTHSPPPDLSPDQEALMVRVVDGVATPAEREELMAIVVANPALGRELEAHLALRAVTDGWVDRLQLDLAEDRARRAPGQSGLAIVGGSLLVGGLLVVYGWGFWRLLTAPDAPIAVRIGLAAAAVGGLVLLAGVVRWRLRVRTHDRYTEVIR